MAKIKLSDLVHRDYEGRECVAFDYYVKLDDEDVFVSNIRVSFTKIPNTNAGPVSLNIWLVQTYYMHDDGEEFCYTLSFNMERKDTKLEDIAARGLYLLMNGVVQKIVCLQRIQFAISDVVGDV